jgi:phosphatidylinositol alpha-mannosyltransferase
MRIALVSPYSWTYPGGVTRHIEALAEQYIAQGHEVRVLAPFDHHDRLASLTHFRAHPQEVQPPDYLIPLGRTVGIKANGAVSNLSLSPWGLAKLRRELRAGDFDVAHIHEPVAPLIGTVATGAPRLPLVGTFHTYSTKWLPNMAGAAGGCRLTLNRLHVRIAVSQAAAWTGRRWYGGRYRVIPNGVHIDEQHRAAVATGWPASSDTAIAAEDPLRIVFVGQAVERKGLSLLLRAFEALREHVPAELTVIGPANHELIPLLLDPTGITSLGKVDDERKHAELRNADVLCAPSLGGESFGMVLTEAFAAGSTVVASDIAGYRDVVSDGVNGVLVPPGDALALAESLREIYHEPARMRALAQAAAHSVERFAWPRIAAEVLESYTDAIEMPSPDTAIEQFGVRIGVVPADLQPPVRARRLPTLEREPVRTPRQRVFALLRRASVAAVVAGGLFLAVLALKKIGLENIASALINSSPAFVAFGLVAMCTAMVMRGFAWNAVLKAALPNARIRLADAIQGTMIGVLMSSTLPARLGEPARALVVARRTGRPRENLPIVLGTIVSQTVLNIGALIVLGAVMFSSVDFFNGHQNVLLAVAIAPVALLLVVLLAPIVLRYGPGGSRMTRVHKAISDVQGALARVRTGLSVFRDPRLGLTAAAAQFSAWALQLLSCYLLLVALGLSHQAGITAAAAVLFAVNVTAVLPATPANLGVFQAACAAVLHTGWHVGYGTGVAYGVILQAVEVTTAILMGTPALLKEGMSWREVRLRAMNAAPVKLPPRHGRSGRHAAPAVKADV